MLKILKLRPSIKLLIILFSGIALSSCSQFSNSITSRSWHNLNAKYNALLIAREDFKYAKSQIDAKEKISNNLPIFRRLDSTALDSSKFYLIDAVKKTSLIAEMHSNSKHVDEAYMILGKARLEKEEYFNAIETFKYLNTKGKTTKAKQEAMILLMRAYIDYEDLISASQVSDILKNQTMNDKNRGLYLLTLAYLSQTQGQNANTVVFLEEALKLQKRGLAKARLHFIAAKLYQSLGETISARKNYNFVLKNKPNYDLEFYSRIGLMTTESLAKNTSLSFKDMLEDRKNQDLKGILYYNMGLIENRKKNFKNAFEYFQKASTETLETDKSQKAEIYKTVADTYFSEILDYQKASLYYDSSLNYIESNTKERDFLIQKKQFLFDFVRYKSALDLEDSLQILSKMNPAELDFKLENLVKQKLENIKKAEEEAAAAKVSLPSTSPTTNGKKSNWILYDPLEIVKAKNEFVRIWGNRQLEDNWRRFEKSSGAFSIKIEKSAVIDSQTSVKVNDDSLKNILENEANQELAFEMADMKKRIPITELQLMASKRKQEEAIFQIAKIYKLKFKDDVKAKQYFNRFLSEYPKSNYNAEALYTMALYEADPAESTFGKELRTNHPYSNFTRLLKVGQKKFDTGKESEVTALYENAYKQYESLDYVAALVTLENGLDNYLGSQLEDMMAMLRIECLKKTNQKDKYTISLNDFVRSYPTSPLLNKAKDLLSALY